MSSHPVTRTARRVILWAQLPFLLAAVHAERDVALARCPAPPSYKCLGMGTISALLSKRCPQPVLLKSQRLEILGTGWNNSSSHSPNNNSHLSRVVGTGATDNYCTALLVVN